MTQPIESTKSNKPVIAVLPGDGIGPEVMTATLPLLDWVQDKTGLDFDVCEDAIGGAAYDRYGVPLSDETLALCRGADFILMGSVGGPKWGPAGLDLPYDKRPEAGLLKLRKELDLYANLRPALVFDALVDASTLKADIVRGLDILIVRELTGGIYFGEPRGIETLANGERKGVNTQSYTTGEIRRIGEIAFELAQKRSGKVSSSEKSNVMESGLLWREEITNLHQEKFSDLALEHIYADNCAMQLLRNPGQFDVIVTDNLFGDILSDEAAMITGSLGMLPSASLGEVDQMTGRRRALYEPVHGSAPDIAGEGKANPLAMILSLGMALKYSLDLPDLAADLDRAVARTLDQGLRTADIAESDSKILTTQDMGRAVLDRL